MMLDAAIVRIVFLRHFDFQNRLYDFDECRPGKNSIPQHMLAKMYQSINLGELNNDIFLILMFAGMINPVFAQSSNSSLQSTAVSIPGGEGGIGFDDLVFSSELHKVLVPAGHTGKLYLIDPASFAMTSIGGFSSSAAFEKGHEVGISSADEGEGFIFAADHGRHELDAVDLKSGIVAATADLAGDADYVRYVGVNHEVWVTEPHNKQIEIFKFSGRDHPMLKATMLIPVPNGPESLVIDHPRGRAYTNLGPQAATIDLQPLRARPIVQLHPQPPPRARGAARAFTRLMHVIEVVPRKSGHGPRP